MKWMTVIVVLGLATGCGGDLDVYGDGADATTSGFDASPSNLGNFPQTDMGGFADTSNPQADAGPMVDPPDADGPDLPTRDMSLPDPDPDPRPTTNVPQSGPSVGEQVTSSCSTITVKGLSQQLIDQMNCLDPGVMKSFDGAPDLSYGAVVFPYQQGPATDALTAVAANNGGTMPISSALRSVPQQYLLYEWYQRGLCNANLAASPGRSNHNGGLAVDIGDSSVWRTPMRNASYVDNVSGEPWHFYYSGAGGKDVRNLSVLAFQQLYNWNFPQNEITEDGLYGPQTETALVASPAEGFAEQPSCQAVMAFVAYPHTVPLDVEWEPYGYGMLAIRTLVPGGIDVVEYYVDGVLAAEATRHDTRRFRAIIDLDVDAGGYAELEIIAYDADGAERGRAKGLAERTNDEPVFVRPLGGRNYEVGFGGTSASTREISLSVDDMLIEQSGRTRFPATTNA